MVGIVSYGFYIPKNRIRTEDIADRWGKNPQHIKKSLGINEKAVASHDEDALTMAYEASVQAFEGSHIKPTHIEAVYVGSENHPYAVNPTSTMLAEYLGVGNNYTAYDTQFACKAATGALFSTFGFVQSGMVKHALVVGTDKATGRPGDPLEYSAGSASVALIVGTNKVLLEFLGGTSYSSDTPDLWRRDGVMFPSHSGRFTAEPGYYCHIIGATKSLLAKYDKNPNDFDHAIFHTPNGTFPARAAKALGFTTEQTKYARVVTELGNSYTAAAFVALCSVLEHAKPGQNIFFVSYGSGAGSDAFMFRVTDEIDNQKKVMEQMIRSKNYIDYVTYLRHMHINQG